MSAQVAHRFVPVMFSVLLAIGASSRGLSADGTSQNREGAAKLAIGASLERILEAWQARQDRTKSLHVVYETRVQSARGTKTKPARARSPVNVSRHELWFDADNRFRFDDSVVERHDQTDGMLQPRSRCAFDGKTHWSLEWFENGTAPSLATTWGPDGLRGLRRTPEALQLTFRPFSRLPSGRRPEEWRLVSENAILDNVHFVKIERSTGDGKVTEDCWVDPARDDVIAAWERLIWGRRRLESSAHLSIRYRHKAEHGWMPASWTLTDSGPVEQECTVIKLTLNEQFPAKTFAPEIPPGTLILDKQANRVGIAAAKNSADGTNPPAQLASVRTALDAKVDFVIRPQPLRDALDLVGTHCQAPLKIDTPAFNRARIDDSMEVQAKLKGRTLLELLMSLCKERPGQVGITVKEGTITVTAAPRVE